MCKSTNQQAPVFICFSKIYWSVHCFHTPCFQPLSGCIKKQKCCLFIVNTFKESYSSCWLFIWLARFLSIKAATLPSEIFLFILKYPALRFTMFEIWIFFRVENCFNFIIKRAYPYLIIFINNSCSIQEFFLFSCQLP